MNQLLTAKQTYGDALATNVTTEQPTPEVEITEVPQATDNSLEWEALTEWLQDESIKKEF